MQNVVGTNLTLAADDNNLTITRIDAYDRANIDGKLETINATVTNKQNKITLGTTVTGSQRLLNTSTSKLKNIVGKNLTLTADDNNLTIEGVYAHDRANIDGKLETINTNVTTKKIK